MDINKLLEVLGFDLNSIKDEKLRVEFLNLLTKLLKGYTIDTTKVTKQNIGEFACNYVYAINKNNNLEYYLDFFYNNTNKIFEFKCSPNLKCEFEDILFGESFYIGYSDEQERIINFKLDKENSSSSLIIDSNDFCYDPETNEFMLTSITKYYDKDEVIRFENQYKSHYGLHTAANIYEVDRMWFEEILNMEGAVITIATDGNKEIIRNTHNNRNGTHMIIIKNGVYISIYDNNFDLLSCNDYSFKEDSLFQECNNIYDKMICAKNKYILESLCKQKAKEKRI